jgi:hypothetical protein
LSRLSTTTRISAILALAIAAGLTSTRTVFVSAAPAAPQFRDATPQSLFSYVTRNDYHSRKYFIQPLCGGVAILDYDKDGKQDIFFTNGAAIPSLKKTSADFDNCLLRNKGGGVFEDVTAAAGLSGHDLGYSLGVAAGDYDNDGYPDLLICNMGENALYHNNRDGTFTRVMGSGLEAKPPGTLSVGAAWFDYDNDGLLDLLVSNYTVWSPETDFRCTDPTLGERYCSPTRFVSVPNQLFHNLGNGKFEDVTAAAGLAGFHGKGMGISIADFNNDGFEDVLVVNDSERNFLFINQRNGTFKEQGFLYGVAFNDDGIVVNGMGSDAKDFDNDGFPDIFYNNLATQVFGLFHNEGGRVFRYVSPSAGLGRLSYRYGGWSAGFVDFDNDGWKDIYSANGDVDYLGDNASQSDTLFRNENGKTFRDVSGTMGAAFLRKGYHRGAAFADLNNDGSMDIVVTGLNEKPRILLNNGTAGAHWLMVDLTGVKSNRDAIGAKVTVTTTSGRKLYNQVSVSVGLMSSSDKRVHFGLGAESSIRSVEIQWPGGKHQTLDSVAADRILHVKEPD